MIKVPTDQLIEALGTEATPVTPLAPPLRRGLVAVGALAGAIAAAVALFAFPHSIEAQAAGGRGTLEFELLAMAATAVLAILGAFHLAVPGRSRLWLYAPLPPFIAWLSLCGTGCYRLLVGVGHAGW